MANLPPYPGSSQDVEPESEQGSTPVARWMTVAVIVVSVLLMLVFVGMHLTGTISPGGH